MNKTKLAGAAVVLALALTMIAAPAVAGGPVSQAAPPVIGPPPGAGGPLVTAPRFTAPNFTVGTVGIVNPTNLTWYLSPGWWGPWTELPENIQPAINSQFQVQYIANQEAFAEYYAISGTFTYRFRVYMNVGTYGGVLRVSAVCDPDVSYDCTFFALPNNPLFGWMTLRPTRPAPIGGPLIQR